MHAHHSTAAIEIFRAALKKNHNHAIPILTLYGINNPAIISPLAHPPDEQTRTKAINQMLDELTKTELINILTYAIAQSTTPEKQPTHQTHTPHQPAPQSRTPH